jgi:hypothetical protein
MVPFCKQFRDRDRSVLRDRPVVHRVALARLSLQDVPSKAVPSASLSSFRKISPSPVQGQMPYRSQVPTCLPQLPMRLPRSVAPLGTHPFQLVITRGHPEMNAGTIPLPSSVLFTGARHRGCRAGESPTIEGLRGRHRQIRDARIEHLRARVAISSPASPAASPRDADRGRPAATPGRADPRPYDRQRHPFLVDAADSSTRTAADVDVDDPPALQPYHLRTAEGSAGIRRPR